ncbi:S41 family peptidase [Roseospira goensis]|uniref:Carboxyl-terminal processing protease n=1 Tax=Roseospira goensis TaxID=391922 RepID=A0A7W6S0D2_9PROT|nr:S41 family peptidase [Roseospira goensis]MBB4286564.1 carboxyl-terminal processing protease [Roseospira goensis]
MMRKTFVIIASGAIALMALATVQLAPSASAQDDETYRLMELFATVFERVKQDYVEQVEDRELMEAAINGMLTSLDPHSSYLNRDHFKDMQVQTRGEFGGLGIEVTMENGLVKVVSPIDDTPAARAGLEPGDYITHLDGAAVTGMTLNEAVDMMRGRVGTDIVLTVRRETREPFDVTITRDVITIKSVRHRMEGEDVGYLRVTSFTEQTDSGLRDSVEALKDEAGDTLKGFVLDLRNNPGGLLDQAVAVADAFLDKGEIVSTRARDLDDTQRFNARPGDLAGGLPMVVIINGGSASASEIVAGALQDHGRALVVGTDSFGKGSVQTIVPLPGNGAMRITTARYYTPSGRSIQAKGIEPDILVPPARLELMDTSRRRTEADLRNALDVDAGGDAGATDEPGGHPDASDANAEAESDDGLSDYQLTRAVDLLRGLALYRERAALQ